MPYRTYTVNQKYLKNKQGDIGVYKKKIKKWIRTNKPYKRQKRGFEKKSIHSARFGFLDLYNRKEQSLLICPSGYSISQCFNVLRLMWYGYHKARSDEKSCEKMIKYAKAIQRVQDDMGLKTTSFPHLGVYGDALILNDKHGNRQVCENHLGLKKKQEEYDKWQANNAKEIQKVLLRPDKTKGQSILSIADDVYPYVQQYDENEQTVPELIKPDRSKGQKILSFPDIIPFKAKFRRPHRRKRQSILSVPDDVYDHKIIESEHEQTVPEIFEPYEEKRRKSIVFSDEIPFKDSTL